MEIKSLFQRLFRPRYLALDKRGVSHLLKQIDFFKERGYASLFSFLNKSNDEIIVVVDGQEGSGMSCMAMQLDQYIKSESLI